MDREAWRAAVHGVAESRTRLSRHTEPRASRRGGPCLWACLSVGVTTASSRHPSGLYYGGSQIEELTQRSGVIGPAPPSKCRQKPLSLGLPLEPRPNPGGRGQDLRCSGRADRGSSHDFQRQVGLATPGLWPWAGPCGAAGTPGRARSAMPLRWAVLNRSVC